MIDECLERMQILNLHPDCVEAFKKGEVWLSEGYGALYTLRDNEKDIVTRFENMSKSKVYHVIHNVYEFGECYSLLYVSPDTDEWENDKNDLHKGYAFVWVENTDQPEFSEFGSIGIRQSFGGVIRC